MGALYKVLKDDTRRRILLLLHERGSLAYTDLMNFLEITNTGKMNYHLKVLGDLISKGEDGKYSLTEKGLLAAQLLLKFPEKTVTPRKLSASDTILIGLLGFLLLLTNPFLWGIAIGGILILGLLLVPLYGTLVPSWVMWRLTVNRIKSHDLYELLKPPLVSAIILVLILVATCFLRLPFPIIQVGVSSYVSPIAFGLLFFAFAPLLGVIVVETLYRIIKAANPCGIPNE
ncbi:MAG: winged helix-turn-helix domain-containing protein [Candidatus Bathyarchaeia archaeon]